MCLAGTQWGHVYTSEPFLKRAKAWREGTTIPLCGIENSDRFGNKHISAVWDHHKLRRSIRSHEGQEGPTSRVTAAFTAGAWESLPPTPQPTFGRTFNR